MKPEGTAPNAKQPQEPQVLAVKQTSLQQFFEKYITTINAALPATVKKHLTPERMIRLMCTAYQTTPALQKCSAKSLLACLIKASEWGLEIGPYGCWPVPFGDQATLIPDYRGMIQVVRRSGEIGDVQAQVVYAHDVFRVEDTEKGTILYHKRCHEPKCGLDHGPVVGAWARAMWRDGSPASIEWMNEAEIQHVRHSSKQPSGLMWKDHPDEARKKTVLKRACKDWPVSWEVQEMLEFDNSVERGAPVVPAIDVELLEPENELAAAATRTAVEALRDKIRKQRQEFKGQGALMTVIDPGKENAEQTIQEFKGQCSQCGNDGKGAADLAVTKSEKGETTVICHNCGNLDFYTEPAASAGAQQ